MSFFTSILILITSLSSLIDARNNIHQFHPSKLLTKQDFSKILFRAINDDEDASFNHLNADERRLRGTNHDKVWDKLMQHGWASVKIHHNQRILRPENVTYEGSIETPTIPTGEDIHPFLLCSSFPDQSGHLRLERIISTFNTSMDNAQTVYNTEETSCFLIVTSTDAVEYAFGDSYPETGETRDSRMAHVTFGPLVDVLKFAAGTPSQILNDKNWMQIDNQPPRKILANTSTVNSSEQHHWAKAFMIDLVPGSLLGSTSNSKSTETVAKEIINYVSAMANVKPGSKPMPIKQNNLTKLSMLRNFEIGSSVKSTREAFSLTSDTSNGSKNPTARSSINVWSDALEHGFESEHGCGGMFDLLDIRPRDANDEEEKDECDDAVDVRGFELILHAPDVRNAQTIDDSALNKQCVLSLIIGLSVHPFVQTIEIVQNLELASITGKSNPQWITQSGTVNSRPFFDNGLDGSGQVVAVADGGLDRDNCYFRDASDNEESIFGGSWDMTKRKIVHYDDTFADQKEISRGHGTYVSGIIAGRKSSNGIDNEVGFADGVAPGSKLSFFDMEVEAQGIQDPGVRRLFESFYNTGKGAKIMNGSWGRSYGGVYTSFCRDWDSLLRSKYSDVLFVVSAGNTGIGAVESSIQNPADCKNALAVGASLSYGKDIRSKEKGIEYLADYSSRGPSADGRIKPGKNNACNLYCSLKCNRLIHYIHMLLSFTMSTQNQDLVAPGHFIVAPNADPTRFGECDSTTPNVQYSLSSGNGGRYVSGTSMSSPTVAGSAAIVRQYFEEGWCSETQCCGSKACGTSFNPSGSLLKAILMNGAQPLSGGVQVVPDGGVLDEPLSEYDSKQGYGRLNLINTLPLTGENKVQLMVVNDKGIRNGAKNDHIVGIDTSNGCDSDLRVTLTWFDPPGSVGCTHCVMNDLDLYIEDIQGNQKFYPNGLSSRDRKNTVERIRVSWMARK